MSRRRNIAAAAAAIAVTLPMVAVTTNAAAFDNPNTDAAGTPSAASDYVLVTLEDDPTASYEGERRGYARTKPERGRLDQNSPAYRNYRRVLENEHANFRAHLNRVAPGAEVLHEYFDVLNGFAVKLNGASAHRLAGGPGVRNVVPSATYQPTMNISNDLIRSSEVWGGLGGADNAGSGIKVGIIDTGIDLSNAFFDDTGLASQSQVDECPDKDGDPGTGDTNDKVIVCRVYASGVTPGASQPPVTLAFDHGTHVAGTVAGRAGTSGTVAGTDVELTDLSGVAPGAKLGDYNVFPGFGAGFIAFGGSAFSHDIIAAIEDALADGMDAVNMSLGGTVQGPRDPLAEASNRAVDAGMVVVVAAGNSGPGDATVESPGSAANVITAGASTNPHFVGISVDVAGGPSLGAALGDFANFDPPVTADYTVTTPANGCSAISEDLTGMIALIDRGVCSFTTKIRNAESAGAVGVLVVNNSAGDPTAMAHDGTTPEPTVPAAMIGLAEGTDIKPSGTMTVDGTSQSEIVSDNADIIAGFSSRGPTPFTYEIKPDITAPGVNVASSVFGGEFAFFQGTSMATPHTAGAVALILDAYPDATPAEVKSRLVNSAARTVTDHVAGADDPGVLARGGGRIDLVEAFDAGTQFDPVSVSFGQITGNRPIEQVVTISVFGDSPATSVSVEPAGALPAEVSVTATLVGDTIEVQLSAARKAPNGDYSGDVVITAADGQQYRVPFWTRVTNR